MTMQRIIGGLQSVLAELPSGENGGVPEAVAPSFDTMMGALFKDVEKAVETPPAAPTPSTAPVAQAPAAALPVVPAPAPATPTQPHAAVVPPVAAQPAAATVQPTLLEQQLTAMAQQNMTLSQTMQQLMQMQAQQLAAAAPKAAPVDDAPPSALNLAKTFQQPSRLQGESDVDYAGRSQGLLLDHINHATARWVTDKTKATADAAVAQYRQQVEEAATRTRAEQAFMGALDNTVKTAGYDMTTDAGRFVHQQALAQLQSAAAQNPQLAQQLTPQQWQAAMKTSVERIGQFVRPPPAAGAPALQVVNGGGGASPPISGQGGTAPTQPASGTPPIAKNFAQSLDNIWQGVAKANGQ